MDRLRTFDELRTISPGQRLLIDDASGLEQKIEQCFKRVGGAVYTVNDIEPGTEAFNVFTEIEQKHPGCHLMYDDNDHVWYSSVTLINHRS